MSKEQNKMTEKKDSVGFSKASSKKELLIVPLHFGKMVHMEYFSTYDTSIKKGEVLLIQSERGTELGTVLSAPQENKGSKETIFGKVIRHSRLAERSKAAIIRDGKERELKQICIDLAKTHDLDMKIQSVEYLLGGERMIFYFTANGRVDFRLLVKELALRFHTRIEMRQIGFRENAKLLSGYGKCGLELCCSSWLKDFPDVTMKMAITQKGSTEKSKTTGQCGKLLCCLQYEDDLYNELKKDLPQRGQKIITKEDAGAVVSVDVLNQRVTYMNDAREYFVVGPDEIKETINLPSDARKNSGRMEAASNANEANRKK